jgi:hypothetical protein
VLTGELKKESPKIAVEWFAQEPDLKSVFNAWMLLKGDRKASAEVPRCCVHSRVAEFRRYTA